MDNSKNEHNMQSQKNMNTQRQISKIIKALGVLTMLLFATVNANAQCNIQVPNATCVDEPILFNCGVAGGSNFNWDFNGESSNTSQCDPLYKFSTPGQKVIKLSMTMANGQTCSVTKTITVNPKPIIDVTLIVNKTQCFTNNSFCFTNASVSGASGGTLCKMKVVFDDGTLYTYTNPLPAQFCHSFGNPAGGTYGMSIELEDCNGCISKKYIKDVSVVQPSLGLTFSSPQPKRCDSVQLCVTNNSAVPLDSIASYTWNWGDGKVTTGNSTNRANWGNPGQVPNPPICHWFKSQGPNGGNFTTKLTVKTKFGCEETFTFNASATNLIVKPVIVASFDSVCISDPSIDFKLKDGSIPQAANPVWNFGNPPSGPLNTVRQWTGSHAAWGLGPYKVNFSFTHAIPGCGRTVYDTILVIGPQSTIEGAPPSGMRWLIDSLRYQCIIKDTVKFENFSKFYHNDRNMTNDDSVIIVEDSIMINKLTYQKVAAGTPFDASIHSWVYSGFNNPMVHGFSGSPNGQTSIDAKKQLRGRECVVRLWDFDDDYCEKCTTDTKKNINVGVNCKYSKDSLPQHWYTPWDQLYTKTFSKRPENVFSYDKDSGLCYTKRMWSYDSAIIKLDTFLYYGDNPLGLSAKDSTIFQSIKNKTKVQSSFQGPGEKIITVATRVYIPAGDTLYVDGNNGLPPNRWIGPRFITIQPGNSMVLKSKTDKILYHYWRVITTDTIPTYFTKIAYYGNNRFGNKVKDSNILNGYDTIQTISGVKGIDSVYLKFQTKIYIPAGDTVFVNPNNGGAAARWIGPRFLPVQKGFSLVLKSQTDSFLYYYWIENVREFNTASNGTYTPGKYRVIPNPQFQVGDSINPDAHRQKFYSSTTVKCYNVKLNHEDTCHKLKCKSEKVTQLALQPPSAKKLRKEGIQCLGGSQKTYGITFILEDTKPSCSRTWAEINYDTALNKNGWLPLIGPNLAGGSVIVGNLPLGPVPYLGYGLMGPAPSRYSKTFTVQDIKDTITGYINVGLIVGTGIWNNNLANGINASTYGYPAECSDTIYYHHFARFPILDNNFRVIKPVEAAPFTKICRKDTICVTTNAWNRTYIPDVAEALWTLEAPNAGKFFNQYYRLSILETYERFKPVTGNPLILEDYLTVERESMFDNVATQVYKKRMKIATITKWHTEADITPVFDIIKTILEANKIDVYELSPAQLSELIWNGQGQFGKPYTGSKGCLDTTGFGRFIRFYKVADEKTSNHYRDTSLIPVDTAKGSDGSLYNAYCFVPQYSGYFVANYALRSIAPENCIKNDRAAKAVIVGYFAMLNYSDTIICHGTPITATPEFRYFNPDPRNDFTVCYVTGNNLLNCKDYWRDRIGLAGNTGMEAVTKWDLNKDDDNLANPATIFGGIPYSQSGLGRNTVTLGGIPGGLYYNEEKGYKYIVRTASGDSTGCRDTIPQNIYVTAVKAKFGIDLTRPACDGILQFLDSAVLEDPCVAALGRPCDKIVEWIINWGDKSPGENNRFVGSLPGNIAHNYTKNGTFMIRYTVKTELGCISHDSIEIYIPGPVPMFDTTIVTKYCVGEIVKFKNWSAHMRRDSSLWIWEFGDGQVNSQSDTITTANDTVTHRYGKPGIYNVVLNQYYKLKVGNSSITCSAFYPDTTYGQTPFKIEIFAYDTTKLLGPIEVCVGDSVNLSGSVIPPGRYNNYKWNFGRSANDSALTSYTDTVLFYTQSGKYTIKFKGDINTANSNNKICPGQDSIILMVGNVVADFNIDSTRKPLFCFENASTNNNNTDNKWSFYVNESNIQNPNAARPKPKVFIPDGNTSDYNTAKICEDYRDSLGSYWICLSVRNDFGCFDTICKKIVNNFQANIQPPNVFTPNGDGQFNDLYDINIKGQEKYDLRIYDRWGVLVFESTDANNDWNGKVKNTGAVCPAGVYYYLLKYRFSGKDADEQPINGVIHLIR